MTNKLEILKAEYSGVLHIGDIEIPCYVLENGERILSTRGVMKSLGRTWRGRKYAGTELPVFLEAKNLKVLLTKDIDAVLGPQIFKTDKGTVSEGYKAILLPMVCEIYLRARDVGVLTQAQMKVAHQADVLMRGFAHVGITALIDEATGYQDVRVKEALEKILNAYLLQEKKPYIGMFPIWFYKEIYRLNNWRWSPENARKRPGVIGRWTNELIYKKLAPGLLRELQKRNPTIKPGQREFKHFQLLTDEVGDPALKSHFAGLGALMRANTIWRKFRAQAEKAYPDPDKTLELELGYSNESDEE